MPFDLSPVQLLIVLAIVLLVFGARRIPELARGLGSGVREFKDGVSGMSTAIGSDGSGVDVPEGDAPRADEAPVSHERREPAELSGPRPGGHDAP